ncbi:hypothetical protein [Brevundimonas vesicularis]|uniref:hypothetical protein n=1 Tax=Brevundimonas vesicularis TaxID=41276 RepID=UPI0038D424DA
MSLRLLLLAVCALSGCASLPGPKLSTCDGATRRPANPHGSILSPEPAPMAAVAVDIQTPPSGGCT